MKWSFAISPLMLVLGMWWPTSAARLCFRNLLLLCFTWVTNEKRDRGLTSCGRGFTRGASDDAFFHRRSCRKMCSFLPTLWAGMSSLCELLTSDSYFGLAIWFLSTSLIIPKIVFMIQFSLALQAPKPSHLSILWLKNFLPVGAELTKTFKSSQRCHGRSPAARPNACAILRSSNFGRLITDCLLAFPDDSSTGDLVHCSVKPRVQLPRLDPSLWCLLEALKMVSASSLRILVHQPLLLAYMKMLNFPCPHNSLLSNALDVWVELKACKRSCCSEIHAVTLQKFLVGETFIHDNLGDSWSWNIKWTIFWLSKG